MFGLGAAGIIGGIVLISNNSSTGVDQFNEAPKKSAFVPGSDVWKRGPVWPLAEDEKSTPAPAHAVAVPIFTGRF
jgi:hypothetical protein